MSEAAPPTPEPGAGADDLQRRLAEAERRAADAERRAADAEAELERLSAEVAELRDAAAPISIFDGAAEDHAVRDDGSDPRIMSVALGATAVVAGLVALLALLNGNLATPFGLAMVALACILGYAATLSRPQPVEISVNHGVVYAERGGTTYRFDLRSEATHVEMVGNPGDAYWQVKFLRRHMDPFVVDADMVDPASFVAQLREYRPAL